MGNSSCAPTGRRSLLGDDLLVHSVASDFAPILAADFRERATACFAVRDTAFDAAGGDHVLNPGMDANDVPPRAAAVLIPVIDRPEGATVLLTLRTQHLSSHRGQIAFPGGKIDPDDVSPEAAALREAHEEVGIAPRQVEVLGRFAPYISRTGYDVAPVAGIVGPDVVVRPNPDEVADAFEVPLGFLMDGRLHQRRSLMWKDKERFFWAMPWRDETRVPAVDRPIWGLTAGIIRMVWERLYARETA